MSDFMGCAFRAAPIARHGFYRKKLGMSYACTFAATLFKK
jgi:hypothetical protein